MCAELRQSVSKFLKRLDLETELAENVLNKARRKVRLPNLGANLNPAYNAVPSPRVPDNFSLARKSTEIG